MLISPILLHDPVFPTLADALDVERTGLAFAKALAAAGHPTHSLRCCIERSRIKRERKALFGYRLQGVDATGEPFDQRLMLILFPYGDASNLPDMSNGQTLVMPAFGPSKLVIEELGGEAWFFPNDRKVHHISDLLCALDGKSELVHYVPEQGCTVRLTKPDGSTLYGKCRVDDRGNLAKRVQQAVGEAQGIRLARIVAHDPAKRIFWQQSVDGQMLDHYDVCARPHHWAGHIASALYAFHSLKPPNALKRLTWQSIADTLTRRIDRLEASFIGLATRLTELAARFAESAPEDGKLVLSHGDLHPGNLLWNGTSFALIDLDTAALAPNALDHGTLAASLVHKAIEANVPDTAITSMLRALREAAHPEIGNRHAFDWAVAASLIGERLYRCSTRLKSPRFVVRELLLDRAERLVACHD